MAASVLKTKYIPLYVSVLVTTVVMALLFLRPDPAFGLTVAVDPPENERNNLSGFQLGEPVVLTARINLEGELENIESATLDLTQISGDAGYTNVVALDLPIDVVTGQVVVVAQGTLVVDVAHTEVEIVPPINGNAYGYQGSGQSGGVITYTLTYTPPLVRGFYEAEVSVTTDQQVVTNKTGFSILGPVVGCCEVAFDDLENLLDGKDPIAGAKLLFAMNLAIDAINFHKIRVILRSAGDLSVQSHSSQTMFKRTDFHPAILEKWDVPPEADFILPFRIPDGVANNTTLQFDIEVEDIAGQTLTETVEVTLSDSRSSLNTYLMPGFNFVTPGLQCVDSTCSGDEYDIAALLAAQTVSRDKLNPAFLAEIPAVTGDVPLDEIVETVFAWDPVSDTFPSYTTSPSANTLLTMKAGNGYIIKTASINGVEPFKVFTDDSPQFEAGTELPVPVKLTFEGTVIIDPGQSLPIYPVEPVWNLVGPHVERDTSVGVFLSPVTFATRKWVSLFEFRNTLEVAFDDEGHVKRLAGGQPELLFVNRFNTLLGPDFGPQPAGDVIRAGSGLWLLMCDGPAEECSGGLAPVLE